MILDKLWRLDWQSKRCTRALRRDIKRLKQSQAGRDQIEAAIQDTVWERDTLLDEIQGTKSFYLIGQANRLGLPTPPRFRLSPDDAELPYEDGPWERGYTSTYCLSRTAQFDLRSRIRLEKKERLEVITSWVKDILVPMTTAVVGILGATMGVLAFLKK